MAHVTGGAEHERITQADDGAEGWRDWGPYVAERAWGTVREDYSADGDAASSRTTTPEVAPTAGTKTGWRPSPTRPRSGASASLWNGEDPILEERMFASPARRATTAKTSRSTGGTSTARPRISNTWRYHYPQAAYPYDDLIQTNADRSKARARSTESSTPASSTNRRYWGGDGRLRQAGPARPARCRSRSRTRARMPRPSMCLAEIVVPQHLELGLSDGGVPQPGPRRGERPRRAPGQHPLTLYLQGEGRRATGIRASAVPRERATNTARVYGEAESESPAYPKDGINYPCGERGRHGRTWR